MLSIVSSGANVIYIPILIKSFGDIFIETVERYVDFKTVGFFLSVNQILPTINQADVTQDTTLTGCTADIETQYGSLSV